MSRVRRMLPIFFLVLIAAISLLAPWIAPHDPLDAVTGQELRPPSAQFWLGTDLLGRDVYSRVLFGGRRTLTIALLALALAVGPGLLIGTLAGYVGGWFDQAVRVVIDALLAFPGLLLALSVIALLGSGSLAVGIAAGVAGLPAYARVARAAARDVRSRPYVEAARAIGATPRAILAAHILPNMLGTLLAFATVTLSWAILNAATLNFLGFGGDPAAPEWGTMLAEGRQAFRIAPWAVIAPGVAIMLTVLATNLVADSLAGRE